MMARPTGEEILAVTATGMGFCAALASTGKSRETIAPIAQMEMIRRMAFSLLFIVDL